MQTRSRLFRQIVRNDAGISAYFKEFWAKMTEKMQVYARSLRGGALILIFDQIYNLIKDWYNNPSPQDIARVFSAKYSEKRLPIIIWTDSKRRVTSVSGYILPSAILMILSACSASSGLCVIIIIVLSDSLCIF